MTETAAIDRPSVAKPVLDGDPASLRPSARPHCRSTLIAAESTSASSKLMA